MRPQRITRHQHKNQFGGKLPNHYYNFQLPLIQLPFSNQDRVDLIVALGCVVGVICLLIDYAGI